MATRSTRGATVAAVVVVVLVAVGVISYQLGRRDPSTAPPPPPSTPPISAGSTSASTSTPVSTGTDGGTTQAGLPVGAAKSGASAAKTGPAGLPLGYTHDRTGAVQAATNYLIWMNSLRIADKKDADAMAATTAQDDATRAAMIKSFDVLRSGMENVTRDEPQPARGAYAIAAYSSSAARIYVWTPVVVTDTTHKNINLWSIFEVKLSWHANDWKVNGTLISRVGGAAINPSDPNGNPSSAEKAAILSRTPADPGEITDTAQQSWFEYANAQH